MAAGAACSCRTTPTRPSTALRVGVALSAANYDLKPESAKTKTLGFDWKPAIGTGTKLSATWFDITTTTRSSARCRT